jgi:SAC3 family protein LENG8/THP3
MLHHFQIVVSKHIAFNSRYRPDIDVRFITDELGFESDAECVEFLEKRNAEIVATDGRLRLKTKESLDAFEADRRRLFRVVDIKGQL